MYVELIHNVVLLVALCALYSLLGRMRQRHEEWARVGLGLLFGGIAIAGMMMPFRYAPGIIYDGRSIVLTLAGLFGGGTCAAIAAVLAGAYRAFLGGPGIWAGLATIAATSLVGLFFRRKAGNHPEKYAPLLLYGIGIVAHIVMLACQLLIPWPAGLTVIQNIWLPVMLLFPATTMVIGCLLGTEEQRLVTQRKLAENQELLSKSQAIGNVGSWKYDIAEDTLLWSDQVFRIFGVDPENFAATIEAFLEHVHPDDREAVYSAYTRSVDEGRDVYEIEHRIVRQDTGEIRFVQQRCRHHKDSAGRIVRSIGVVRDITERVQAMEALEASERKYRSLFNSMNEGFALHRMVYDEHGKPVDYEIIDLNPAFEIHTNIPRESAKNRLATQIYQTCPPPYVDIYAKVAETGEHTDFESYFPPMGKHFQISVFSPMKGWFGTIFADITERKLTEEALRESERKLRIYNKISNIFLLASHEDMYSEVLTIIRTVTKSRLGIFGYIDETENWVCPSLTRDVWGQCQVPDKHIVFPKEKWAGIWGQAMLEKRTLWSNEPFKTPEGHVPITCAMAVPILYAGQLIGNIALANKETPYDEADVALVETIAKHIAPILSSRLQRDREQREKEKTQEQLMQAQKMESIGRLAGGVAHDFNNLLTTIIGNAQLVLSGLEKEDPLREEIEEIRKAGERAAGLSRQLLTFSRRETRAPELLNLNETLDEMAKMLRRLIREDIELVISPGPDLGPVYMDPPQVEQVIMNLVVNARDAMPDGGTLTIETADTELDEAYFREHGVENEPGPYVMLAVTDTGIGMDEETQSKMFDPFFTTKDRSTGTGLGLATVYGIVKQNRGYVWAYSEPGRGTTVKVYLPRAGEVLEPGRSGDMEVGGGLTGAETVLVVEDNQQVLDITLKVLARYGYRTLAARNGDEAVRVGRDFEGKIHLLVTDVIMPGMNGKELAERLRSERPDMKVLFMSGYTENIIVQKGILPTDIHYIQKPFSFEGLARKVRDALGD